MFLILWSSNIFKPFHQLSTCHHIFFKHHFRPHSQYIFPKFRMIIECFIYDHIFQGLCMFSYSNNFIQSSFVMTIFSQLHVFLINDKLITIPQFPIQHLQKFRHQSISKRSAKFCTVSIKYIFWIDCIHYISRNQSSIIQSRVIHKSCPVETGIRQIDSEFCFVLGMLRFGKFDKVSHGFGKSFFRDSSGSIVLANDLKGSIAIIWQIITTICFSISGCYRQGGRKIIRKTDGIKRIVSSRTGKLITDILNFSCEILGDKFLFKGLGTYFCFIFFYREFRNKMGIEFA